MEGHFDVWTSPPCSITSVVHILQVDLFRFRMYRVYEPELCPLAYNITLHICIYTSKSRKTSH